MLLHEETVRWRLSENVELGASAESRRFRKNGDGVVADLETGRGTCLLRRCLYSSQLSCSRFEFGPYSLKVADNSINRPVSRHTGRLSTGGFQWRGYQ